MWRLYSARPRELHRDNGIPEIFKQAAFNLIIVILLLLAALMISLLLAGNALIERNLFPTGTVVGDHSLDGLSYEEGLEFVLEENKTTLDNFAVELDYNGKPITLDSEELGIVEHIERVLYGLSYTVDNPHSLSGVAAIIHPKEGQVIDISPMLDMDLVGRTLQSALSYVDGKGTKPTALGEKAPPLPITGTNEVKDGGVLKVYLTVNVEEFNSFAAAVYEEMYPPAAPEGPVVVPKDLPFSDLIEKYAREYNLEAAYLAAVIYVESNFIPDSESAVGAVGLMQIMPSTGQWIAGQMGIDGATLDLFDPETNIRVGSWYLKYLLDYFGGNIHTSTVAYNAGPVRVSSWLQDSRYSADGKNLDVIPYEETKVHTDLIEGFYEIYKDSFSS